MTIMVRTCSSYRDRKGAWLVLGMTEEEVMTDIARKELRSYKQLPQIWYQIQTKFRDEPRPRAGLLRVRQFIMKDKLFLRSGTTPAWMSATRSTMRPIARSSAAAALTCRGAGRFRRYGRFAIARVYGVRRSRRRPDRQLFGVQLCSQHG